MSKQFRNVVKVLGVAIAVYLALTIKIWLTWETDEVTQFDYLANETKSEEEFMEFEDIEAHGSASAFSKICSKYKTICKKVNRWWTFTDEDKTLKFLYVTYLLKKLDEISYVRFAAVYRKFKDITTFIDFLNSVN